MKNAIILHGIDDSPEGYWFPYLKKQLEEKGYTVWVPQLPGADNPDVNIQLPYVLTNGKFTEETIIIGHSSGACLVLAIIEALPTRINRAILVSGWIQKGGIRPKKITKDEYLYDWKKINNNVTDITFINSDNDPWGCDDKQGRLLLDSIGKGKQIVMKGEGHMGSISYNQPYKEFPLLLKLID